MFSAQPSFQQRNWIEEREPKLQAFVEKLHPNWTTRPDYIAPTTRGKRVALDPVLIVTYQTKR